MKKSLALLMGLTLVGCGQSATEEVVPEIETTPVVIEETTTPVVEVETIEVVVPTETIEMPAPEESAAPTPDTGAMEMIPAVENVVPLGTNPEA